MGRFWLYLLKTTSVNNLPHKRKEKSLSKNPKANWQSFTDYTEDNFAKLLQYELPTDVYKLERIFRKVLNKASKLFVPTNG